MFRNVLWSMHTGMRGKATGIGITHTRTDLRKTTRRKTDSI